MRMKVYWVLTHKQFEIELIEQTLVVEKLYFKLVHNYCLRMTFEVV